VKNFQTDDGVKVFLAQIATAGLGITLTAADTAIFYSMDLNYANYEQAKARIHRIGQSNTCLYIHLLMENTIDEKILDLVKRKDTLAKSVLDNWKWYFD
jgi:SNF2 family DNA or RNA helicase